MKKQKSRLCTYGSVCEQEEQSIVYTFLIQSTSLQCQKTDLKLGLPLNTGGKNFFIKYASCCIMGKKKGGGDSLHFTHSSIEERRAGKINSANLLLKQFS